MRPFTFFILFWRANGTRQVQSTSTSLLCSHKVAINFVVTWIDMDFHCRKQGEWIRKATNRSDSAIVIIAVGRVPRETTLVVCLEKLQSKHESTNSPESTDQPTSLFGKAVTLQLPSCSPRKKPLSYGYPTILKSFADDFEAVKSTAANKWQWLLLRLFI